MGTPSSRRPNPRANSHQRSSRTSAPSPRNRGDRPPSNSPPTNTSDSQSSTSPHPRSPTATPSTVSRWDQCASTRRHTTSHTNIHGTPDDPGVTARVITTRNHNQTESLGGRTITGRQNTRHSGPAEPARDRETRTGRLWGVDATLLERLKQKRERRKKRGRCTIFI